MNDVDMRLRQAELTLRDTSHAPLGQLLLEANKLAPEALQHALRLQKRIDAPLGDIMVSEGLVKKRDVLAALAKQARAEGVDLDLKPPAPEMASALPASLSLKYNVVPWREDAQALYVATSSPTGCAKLRKSMAAKRLSLFPVIVDDAQIKAFQSRLYGAELARSAETKVASHESCRGWTDHRLRRTLWAVGAVAVLAVALVKFPAWTVTILALWALLTLAMVGTLKAAALWVHVTRKTRETPAPSMQPNFRMPRVSVLVPLLKEREIAEQLIERLSQLTYPKSLLSVALVLEEDDKTTQETIARTVLPDWISVVEVPATDGLTTKPRALNYALNFCNGSIVGVWDAEDWPEPDQIEKVVARFNAAPEDVACLQGVLDYYNSRSTWLARCFTIEYAIWWRIVMPGLASLGLVVPLGGTTLFFKRHVLEQLGGWDAHNVTEDADLGVRLARHGYRTELLPTVTREEATSRAWPRVRQRSRWLKGFLVTYFVHMRRPRALIRDLGIKRFLGVQTIFLAAFSQFATAPILWTFWVTLLGVNHPVADTLGSPVV